MNVRNILILHSGLTGITNACLELANRLKMAGHQVCTGSMKDQKTTITDNSFEHVHIQPVQFNYSERKGYDSIYADLDFPSFDGLLRHKKIDLVLIDMELHEYIIYLRSINMPFVLISQWFSNWRAPNNLPLSSLKTPGSNLQQRFLWSSNRWLGMAKTIGNSIKTRGYNRRNFLLYLAKKLSFDRKEWQSYSFPLPFSYRTFPVLSTTHPDLEFNPQSRPNLFYAYPMVFDRRKEQVDPQFTSDFDRILQEKKASGKKLIVVTQTTMTGGSGDILPKLTAALARFDDYISIVSLGAAYKKYAASLNHKNVLTYPAIPQLLALRHADLSINHGGIHTINECIHFNFPMLVISGKKYDQNGCAARVAHHGCGMSLNRKKCSEDRLYTAINDILTSAKYTTKMSDLHTSYKKAQSVKRLETYLEQL